MIYQWAVIGAGPAGIAAIGNLLDHGIPGEQIIWIDPQFHVGDFGTRWRNVSSNTKVGLFIKFLESSPSFDFQRNKQDFPIYFENLEDTCYLRLMAKPLQWITDELKNKVCSKQDFARALSLEKRAWHIELRNKQIAAKNVILAIGSEPKELNYSIPTIPLDIAMDREQLMSHLEADETIAVFGSSHSAILVIRNLVETHTGQVINFYLKPLIYAVYLKNWILFDDTGLKGQAAQWAKKYIDGELPKNLKRIFASTENIDTNLPQCHRVIYAIGFERRKFPLIKGINQFNYIKECGIIAPGLFGLGIAFPEAKKNPLGMLEYRVGLWKFMEFLHRIMPIWLKYSP